MQVKNPTQAFHSPSESFTVHQLSWFRISASLRLFSKDVVPKDLLSRNAPFNDQLINGLVICQLSPVFCTASGGGMQLKNVQLFHPSHPHPELGFTPSSIKTPVIVESRTKGPPRVTVPSLSLYCTHRCLAWEQHGHISIRIFLLTGD